MDNTVEPTSALIVDDINEMRALLKVMLKKNGITDIVEASNGAAALQSYSQALPDMVFLDINMPDNSGLEVLEALLKQDSFAYVVMVSGESTVKNVKKALDLGARGFVVKPYTYQKIAEMIERYKTVY